MSKIKRFWKIALTDTLAAVLIIVSPFTGTIPGPGGIPIFLLGLSLLAIHHDWAQRYIDYTRQYADDLGRLIFVNNPTVQLAYDIGGSLLLAAGLYLAWQHSAWWQLSAGLAVFFGGLTLLLGNRHRWRRFKATLKHKL